ncbi:GNAT family N-acetyltransferase [Deinococcus radiomollis]|uniref:N-acetyltransferase n=1 Tax=Deinococcus radiomollis TaxID=468916 RepID=UPI003892A575
MTEITIRQACPDDAFLLAPLLNSTQEPHFHTTAERLRAAMQKEDAVKYLLAERAGQLLGSVSLSFPDFHPQHVWLRFALHPDHRAGREAAGLFQKAGALAQGRPFAWTSVRADYLSTQPDLPALGFHEVHRTFGGGFYLDAPPASRQRLEDDLAQHGIRITPAAGFQGDPRLETLYQTVKQDKATAEPTIPAANDLLNDPESLWDAAFVALRGAEALGLVLPERARLGAWNAVLLVRQDMRRQGIGTALQARACAALWTQGVTFLNTAGVKTDRAYLGVLRQLGANIEPDWIAYEAVMA